MPFPSEKDTQLRIDLIADAASRGQRTLVYAYERELDHTGHAQGCGSAAWLDQLARIDTMLARLREALPSDVVLLVTGDHGMVDVPPDRRLVIEDEPELAAGVSVVAGEARFRHLYVDTDDPPSPSPAAGATASAAAPGCGPATRRSTRAGSGRCATRCGERYGDVRRRADGGVGVHDADVPAGDGAGGHARVPDRRSRCGSRWSSRPAGPGR